MDRKKAKVERIRRKYPSGTRVELVNMADPYTELQPGTQGTVGFVDDLGTIFVGWDSGQILGVIPEVDEIRII